MTPWQLSDAGERYVSSSRHAADVQAAVRECLSPRASRLPTVTARADEPESHPANAVAPHPAVIDTDTDAVYNHGMESHDSAKDTFGKGGASLRDSGEGVPTGSLRDAPGKAAHYNRSERTSSARGECDEHQPLKAPAKGALIPAAPTWSEADRQAWLRRVQAER